MIKTLEVYNFKSLKHLKLDCRKVNVFIGEPNTGKSNILESIGIFSLPLLEREQDFKILVRFENMVHLFFDHELKEKIRIIADDIFCEIRFQDNWFTGEAFQQKNGSSSLLFNFDASYSGIRDFSKGLSPFKFYRFSVLEQFPVQKADFLVPPRGENLFQILLTNKELRKFVADIFNQYGLRLVLKPQENKIELQKQIEDIAIAYPYSLISDTLQRVVFHLVAVETNTDSIIIFEEPEAHAFPFYTKLLAEQIASDKTNQYFISTHNPYFLLSILEKTLETDLGIFVTYIEEHQTKVKVIHRDDFPELLDMGESIFFNLDRFLRKK